MKKQLPRIKIIPSSIDLFGDIEGLIGREYLTLIYSDATDYPVDGIELPNQAMEYKEHIDSEGLEEARRLI